MLAHPFSTLWRKGLVSLPRLVPDSVLQWTSPEGPQPIVIELPSRGDYKIPCYIFVPPSICTNGVPIDGIPVLLDFHGGGFVLGSCQEQAVFCAKFARELDMLAISVDYRLGPYSKFPAAIEDGEDILSMLLDPESIGHKQLLQAIRDNMPRFGKVNGGHTAPTSADLSRVATNESAVAQSEDAPPAQDGLLHPPTITVEQAVPKLELGDTTAKGSPLLQRTLTGNHLGVSANPQRPKLKERLTSYRARRRNPIYSKTGELASSIKLDTGRIALSGFSSGGNLALNLVLSVPPMPPLMPEAWPSRFPKSHTLPIPVLLYYPSFDCRLLPSERPRPEALGQPKKSWFGNIGINDNLMPTYLPREMANHPRASPGLAAVVTENPESAGGIHDSAKMALVTPELDSLALQAEEWAKKIEEAGQKDRLTIRRYPGMKHGWTQFPDFVLGEKEKAAKYDSFDFTANYVRELWHLD